MSHASLTNALVEQVDVFLRSMFNVGTAQRPYPYAYSSSVTKIVSISAPAPAPAPTPTPVSASVISISSSISSPTVSSTPALGAQESTMYAADSANARPLSIKEQRHAAGLMRVNHVGEICAQALYAGQALSAKTYAIKQFNLHAALQERDHLLWTAQRLRELNAKPSLLNPLWYSGSWAMGVVAGLMGDKLSLSFVQETEAQVEAHLSGHESLLPIADQVSRAVVAQMKTDEAQHAEQARLLGAAPLPAPIRLAMKLSAKVMTQTAYYV